MPYSLMPIVKYSVNFDERASSLVGGKTWSANVRFFIRYRPKAAIRIGVANKGRFSIPNRLLSFGIVKNIRTIDEIPRSVGNTSTSAYTPINLAPTSNKHFL